MSNGIVALLASGYLLNAGLGFWVGYLLGRRRRPPRRVQVKLGR